MMTHPRIATLGVAVSGLALLAGSGSAQPLPNPPLAQLTAATPKLESISGSNQNCQSTGLVFTIAGSGYQGSADVFEGPAALILTGTRLQEVSEVAVVLANGTRLRPLTRTACAAPTGKTAIRVTFSLPGAASGGARLVLMAPEPPPLVRAPTPPTKVCIDRITGQPTGCPDLPPVSTTPRILKIADVGLTLVARPRIDGVQPDRINATGASESCRGRVVFSGRNLSQARLVADAPGTNFGASIAFQTATSITADLSKRCPANGIVATLIEAAAFVRRGPDGAARDVSRCDTCSDAPAGGSFGGGAVRFAGP